jgi:hypothetical protein
LAHIQFFSFFPWYLFYAAGTKKSRSGHGRYSSSMPSKTALGPA